MLVSSVSVALGSACGGKVTFTPDANGVGGFGGAGGSSSSSSASVDPSSSVSTNETVQASVGVSTAVAVAASSSTGPSMPDCITLGFNGIGAQCGVEGAECSVPYACCGGNAICKGGTWVSEGALCSSPCVPCSDTFECQIGAVCVVDEPDFTKTFQCAANPCPNQPLDCSCAQSVCKGNFLQCAQTLNSTVICDCPTCLD